MKHQKFTFVVAVFALLAGCALAQAQQKIAADIGFKFMAGSTAMAPGKYNVESQGTGAVTIRDAAGKSSAVLPALTILGRHDTHQMAELVFDRVGEALHLSEIWFGGGADGILVLATKEPHKHQVLEVK
jgi:hypothetical protein